MSLGKRLRELRMERGWSQAELARRAGVSQPTISTYETNPKTEYRAHVLFKIAAALQVSPEYLRTGRGPVNISDLKANNLELLQEIDSLPEDKKALLLSVVRSMKG